MHVTALCDKILVKQLSFKDFIPNTIKRKANPPDPFDIDIKIGDYDTCSIGEVLSIGDGKDCANGVIKPPVSVGDIIIFNNRENFSFEISTDIYLSFITEKDLLGLVTQVK